VQEIQLNRTHLMAMWIG